MGPTSLRVSVLCSLGLLHACGGRETASSGVTRDGEDANEPAKAPSAQDPAPSNGAMNEPDALPAATPVMPAPATITPTTTAPSTMTPVTTVAPSAVETSVPTPQTAPPSNTPAPNPPPGTPSSDGAMPPAALVCENAQPSTAMGLVSCDNGVVQRSPGACTSSLPRPDVWIGPMPSGLDASVSDTEMYYECHVDADCVDAPHGYCSYESFLQPSEIVGAICNYGCVEDADCDAGSVCLCGDPIGQCVPATCKSDDDCNEGELCAYYSGADFLCGPQPSFACAKATDDCVFSGCADLNNICVPDANTGLWSCEYAACGSSGIGRPFLVAGTARIAQLRPGRDWNHPSIRETDVASDAALTPEQRRELASAWLDMALMEHASIAAFARFTLQLQSVAAPAHLVQQSLHAMVDETDHARRCFALARRFGQQAVQPGPLPIAQCLEASDLEHITLQTALEGCIGETVATLEAQRALQNATDPDVSATLAVIARDEERHATLAFEFVRWAIARQPQLTGSLLALVEQEARRSDDLRNHHGAEAQTQSLHAHGVLSSAERRTARKQALQHVVLPCIRALCLHQDVDLPRNHSMRPASLSRS